MNKKDEKRPRELGLVEEKKPRKAQNANPHDNFSLIYNVLKKFSSQERPMSSSDIHKCLMQLNFASIPVVKTIQNTLEKIVENPNSVNSPMKIKCVGKYNGRYIDYQTLCQIRQKSKKTTELTSQQHANRYYYLENPLSRGEWRALMDVIRFSPWISQGQTERFLKVFEHFGGLPNVSDQAYYKFKRENLTQFEIIRTIDEGIQTGKRILITYGTHDLKSVNGKLVPHLVPRNEVLKDKKSELEVSPFSMVWANGQYYLVAEYSENKRLHLRVDRILAVTLTEISFQKPDNFNIVMHRDSSPLMYGGKKDMITFTCKIDFLSKIMDFFGSTPNYHKSNDKIEVTVEASNSGFKLFALQNLQAIEVLRPAKLREEIAEILEKNLTIYKKSE